MKAIEFIVLLAVIIIGTLIFGGWGLIGGVVVVILVATDKLKTGLEDRDIKKDKK